MFLRAIVIQYVLEYAFSCGIQDKQTDRNTDRQADRQQIGILAGAKCLVVVMSLVVKVRPEV